MKTFLIAAASALALTSGAAAQTYKPWKPAAGETYTTPGTTAQQPAPAYQAPQPATGYQTQQTPQGYQVQPAPGYQVQPAQTYQAQPAQPVQPYQAQPAQGYQVQPAPGYQVQPTQPQQPYPSQGATIYLPPAAGTQPGLAPSPDGVSPYTPRPPQPYVPTAANWEWQLGGVLPDIEACMRRTELKDAVIDGVYKGRRGASRVRIEGRGPTGATAQEECLARDRGVAIRTVEAGEPPIDGMGLVVYAPVGSRIVISEQNIMQPVISGGSRRLIGWLLRGRDANTPQRMGEPITINGYPD